MKDELYRWAGIQWYPKKALAMNKPNATYHLEHFLFDNCDLVTRRTKKEMKEYIDKKYGYIKTRKDLRSSPHFWRIPKPVKVKISIAVESKGEE